MSSRNKGRFKYSPHSPTFFVPIRMRKKTVQYVEGESSRFSPWTAGTVKEVLK